MKSFEKVYNTRAIDPSYVLAAELKDTGWGYGKPYNKWSSWEIKVLLGSEWVVVAHGGSGNLNISDEEAAVAKFNELIESWSVGK